MAAAAASWSVLGAVTHKRAGASVLPTNFTVNSANQPPLPSPVRAAIMPTTPPPPPDKPVLKRDGFTVRDGIITSQGHERVDGSRLDALFHPERLRLQRDQKKAAEDAKRLFSRSFFAAQLRYYGITFPKTATEAQLQSLLEKAVAAKQVIQVGPCSLSGP